MLLQNDTNSCIFDYIIMYMYSAMNIHITDHLLHIYVYECTAIPPTKIRYKTKVSVQKLLILQNKKNVQQIKQ